LWESSGIAEGLLWVNYFRNISFILLLIVPLYSADLYCRGSLEFLAGKRFDHDHDNSYTIVKIQANDRAAGRSGHLLSKGTCAWSDRILHRDEITTLHISELMGVNLPLGKLIDPILLVPKTAMIPLFNCLQNEKCVFKIGVENLGRHFEGGKEYTFYFN